MNEFPWTEVIGVSLISIALTTCAIKRGEAPLRPPPDPSGYARYYDSGYRPPESPYAGHRHDGAQFAPAAYEDPSIVYKARRHPEAARAPETVTYYEAAPVWRDCGPRPEPLERPAIVCR